MISCVGSGLATWYERELQQYLRQAVDSRCCPVAGRSGSLAFPECCDSAQTFSEFHDAMRRP